MIGLRFRTREHSSLTHYWAREERPLDMNLLPSLSSGESSGSEIIQDFTALRDTGKAAISYSYVLMDVDNQNCWDLLSVLIQFSARFKSSL